MPLLRRVGRSNRFGARLGEVGADAGKIEKGIVKCARVAINVGDTVARTPILVKDAAGPVTTLEKNM